MRLKLVKIFENQARLILIGQKIVKHMREWGGMYEMDNTIHDEQGQGTPVSQKIRDHLIAASISSFSIKPPSTHYTLYFAVFTTFFDSLSPFPFYFPSSTFHVFTLLLQTPFNYCWTVSQNQRKFLSNLIFNQIRNNPNT